MLYSQTGRQVFRRLTIYRDIVIAVAGVGCRPELKNARNGGTGICIPTNILKTDLKQAPSGAEASVVAGAAAGPVAHGRARVTSRDRDMVATATGVTVARTGCGSSAAARSVPAKKAARLDRAPVGAGEAEVAVEAVAAPGPGAGHGAVISAAPYWPCCPSGPCTVTK